MLTIKLMKGHTMKIVEATEVNIYPAGKPELVPTKKGAEPMELPTNKIRELSVKLYTGQQEAFYISDGDLTPHEHLGSIETLWDCAYVENAHGATTEKIAAY